MTSASFTAGVLAALFAVAACVTANEPGPGDADPGADAGPLDLGALSKDAGARGATSRDAAPSDDGGDPSASTSPVRFVTKVVSFTPGRCAGFGQASLPQIVLGPPMGGGDSKGSLDVVSLGNGGEIVLSFEPAIIVDGPGVDFIVFENAFYASGDPTNPYVELGEVSVSEDGATWTTFPCVATAAPYGTCAGWHPVYATDEQSAADVDHAGGDPFDLATIGVARARFVKIKDRTSQRCTSQGPDTNGFDLDAIAALHSDAP